MMWSGVVAREAVVPTEQHSHRYDGTGDGRGSAWNAVVRHGRRPQR
jgi:hypothetical protein